MNTYFIKFLFILFLLLLAAPFIGLVSVYPSVCFSHLAHPQNIHSPGGRIHAASARFGAFVREQTYLYTIFIGKYTIVSICKAVLRMKQDRVARCIKSSIQYLWGQAERSESDRKCENFFRLGCDRRFATVHRIKYRHRTTSQRQNLVCRLFVESTRLCMLEYRSKGCVKVMWPPKILANMCQYLENGKSKGTVTTEDKQEIICDFDWHWRSFTYCKPYRMVFFSYSWLVKPRLQLPACSR